MWKKSNAPYYDSVTYRAISSCLSVRLSVCPTVTLCIVALGVEVGGWKLYRRVPAGRTLPIYFFSRSCCRMQAYRSAMHNIYSDKPNRWNFRVWNIHCIMDDHVIIAIPDVAFSAVRFCSYTVRSAFLATATLLVISVQGRLRRR